jgi:heat shock protein HslJ
MNKLIGITISAALVATGIAVTSGAAYADGQIWQRTFRAVSVTENGQSRPLLPGNWIRIEFPNNRLRAGAGCGQITGTAAMTGTRLTVSEVNLLRNNACTNEAAFAQDAWLAGFLDRDPCVALNGHTLVLSAQGVRFTLTDSPDVAVDPPLIGTRWIIESVIENGVTTALPPFPQPHLVFEPDGTLWAMAGCNTVSGSAVHRDGGATLGQAAISKRLCEFGNPILEETVMAALDAGDVTFQITAGRLTVDRPGGPTLLARSESLS